MRSKLSKAKWIFFIIAGLTLLLVTSCNNSGDTPTPAQTPTTGPSSMQNNVALTTPSPVTSTAAPVVKTTEPLVFKVDRKNSKASYTVTETTLISSFYHTTVGTAQVTGESVASQGTIKLFKQTPAQSTVTGLHVPLADLQSDNSSRDGYLAGSVLDTSSYPDAEFSSTSVEGLPATITDKQPLNFRILGTMKIHGVEKPLTFTATATVDGNILQAEATSYFNMTDFKIQNPELLNLTKIEPVVTIHISLKVPAQ